MKYVNLRSYTTASMDFGIFDYNGAIAKTQENPEEYTPSFAVTEHNNMFSVIDFYKSATDNFKSIIGVEITFAKESKHIVKMHEITGTRESEKIEYELYDNLMIAKNNDGYTNLCKLQTIFYKSKKHDRIPDSVALENKNLFKDVYVLSGGIGNNSFLTNKYKEILRIRDDKYKPLEQKQKEEQDVINKIKEHISFWQELTDNNYMIELQREGREKENDYIKFILPIAVELAVPVVATNNTYFLNRDDFETHELFMAHKNDYPVFQRGHGVIQPTVENYFKSNSEMTELFKDIPVALQNSVLIGESTEVKFDLAHPTYHLPTIDSPIPGETLNDYFKRSAREGLDERLLVFMDAYASGKKLPVENNYFLQFAEWETDTPNNMMTREEKLDVIHNSELYKKYRERLEFELDIIIEMQFPSYFLVVSDFIKWSKNNDIPVGPGRGSGAGSLVAYSLKITDLDPLQFNLLFERFLNPERVSMPDFDIDFASKDRERVVQYVRHKYNKGADIYVSQIMNVGKYDLKSSIEMAAKSYGIRTNHEMVKEIKNLFGVKDKDEDVDVIDEEEQEKEELNSDFFKELAGSNIYQVRYHHAPLFHKIVNAASKFYKNMRNVGVHAAGVVISSKPLDEILPITNGGDGFVTQLNKDNAEALGVVKFDFLALKNLDIIQNTINLVNIGREKEGRQRLTMEHLNHINLYNQKVYENIFHTGNTLNVFQFASSGMINMLKKAKPTNFEEIIALVALYRPGPMDNLPDFINRMNGEPFEYIHPLLKDILEPTYGIMVYQEQVMQAAQIIAGYSLGGADMLRRAMGKKKPAEMVKHREIFAEGAAKNGISREKSDEIFDYMEKFAGYGFNKSHAAAYALIAYQTAWLKTNYPKQYMTCILQSDIDNNSKDLNKEINISDAIKNGIPLKTVDYNESRDNYYLNDNGEIVMPFSSIKGFNSNFSRMIEYVRDSMDNGRFNGLYDFVKQMSTNGLSKSLFTQLIRAGAFDNADKKNNTKFYLENAEAIMKNVMIGVSRVQSPLLKGLPSSYIKASAKANNKKADYVEVIYDRTAEEKIKDIHKSFGFITEGNPVLLDYIKEINNTMSLFSNGNKNLSNITDSISEIIKQKKEYADTLQRDGAKLAPKSVKTDNAVIGYIVDDYEKHDLKFLVVETDGGQFILKSGDSSVMTYKFNKFEPMVFLVESSVTKASFNGDDINYRELEKINLKMLDVYSMDKWLSQFTNEVRFSGDVELFTDIIHKTNAQADENSSHVFDVRIDGYEKPIKVALNGNFVNEMLNNDLHFDIDIDDGLLLENGKVNPQSLDGNLSGMKSHETMFDRLKNCNLYEIACNSTAQPIENLTFSQTDMIDEHLLFGYIKTITYYKDKVSNIVFVDEAGKELEIKCKDMPKNTAYSTYSPCLLKVQKTKYSKGDAFFQLKDIYLDKDTSKIRSVEKYYTHNFESFDHETQSKEGYVPVHLVVDDYVTNQVVYVPSGFEDENIFPLYDLNKFKYSVANIPPKYEENPTYYAASYLFDESNKLPANCAYLFGKKKYTDTFTTIESLKTHGKAMAYNEEEVVCCAVVSDFGKEDKGFGRAVRLTDTSGSIDFLIKSDFDFESARDSGSVLIFKFAPSVGKNGMMYVNLKDIIDLNYAVEQNVQRVSINKDIDVSDYLVEKGVAITTKKDGKNEIVGQVNYTEELRQTLMKRFELSDNDLFLLLSLNKKNPVDFRQRNIFANKSKKVEYKK